MWSHPTYISICTKDGANVAVNTVGLLYALHEHTSLKGEMQYFSIHTARGFHCND